MSRQLILGGGGFVGRHVARDLLAAGHEVLIAGRSVDAPPGLIETLGGEGRLRYVRIDLSTASWSQLLADIDVVHHYAWASVPHTSNAAPLEDFEQHVAGTMRLLEGLKRVGGKRIVFISSGGTVYGKIGRRAAREDDPQRPVSAYGAGKLAVEAYLRAYHLSGWIDARIARLSNPYGAGQNPNRNQGAISTFLHLALDQRPIQIWGDGETVRDYVHVCDIADALTRLGLEDLEPDQDDLHVFNVGSGEGVSLNEVIRTIEAALGRAVEVSRGPGRPFDVPFSVLDVTHARDRLGWGPSIGLADGVARMLGDVRAGSLLSAASARLAGLSGVDGVAPLG